MLDKTSGCDAEESSQRQRENASFWDIENTGTSRRRYHEQRSSAPSAVKRKASATSKANHLRESQSSLSVSSSTSPVKTDNGNFFSSRRYPGTSSRKRIRKKSRFFVRMQMFLQRIVLSISKAIVSRSGNKPANFAFTVILCLAATGFLVHWVRLTFFQTINGVLPVPRREISQIGSSPLNVTIKLQTGHGRHFSVSKPMESLEEIDVDGFDSIDFGQVEPLRIIEGGIWSRQLYSDPGLKETLVVKAQQVDVDLAIDDDYFANTNWLFEDEPERVHTRHCRAQSFESNHFPNCNTVHEESWTEALRNDAMKLIGNGAYRDVFRIGNDHSVDHFVYKTMRYDSRHGGTETYTVEDYYSMRIDAVVAELFTSSNRITDIYGYCGVTMFGEFMPYGDVEQISQTFARGTLKDYTQNQLLRLNELAPQLKLRIALEMAEAVSLLHSYDEGVIVHDDIQLSQFLFTKEGRDDWKGASQIVKLNDFNRAVPMQYDEEHQEYCRYLNGHGAGDWRSPEEYLDNPLNEKIDVYSIGMNIFGLVTGLVPFPEETDYRDVHRRVIDGERPMIDKRIRTRSFEEGRLAEIAEKCFVHNPDERPDIFEVVRMLRDTFEESRRRQKPK